MSSELDYEIIREAGVGQKEFGDIVGTSRVTVNNWVNGKTNPSRHLEKTVRNHLTLLKAAVRLKLLPGDIPSMHKTNVEARRKFIRAKLNLAAKKLRARKRAAKKK